MCDTKFHVVLCPAPTRLAGDATVRTLISSGEQCRPLIVTESCRMTTESAHPGFRRRQQQRGHSALYCALSFTASAST